MKNKAISGAIFALGLVLSLGVAAAPRSASAQNTPCRVTSFTATPNNITAGSSATLTWTTSGCSTASLSGGQFITPQYLFANSSVSTGALSGTTTFWLSASANGSTAAPVQTTVYVVGGPYPYISGGTNIGGTNPSLTAITVPASNVGSTSARLNGVVANSGGGTFNAHFEYGTDYLVLDRATPTQSGFTSTIQIYDTISVRPSTTYYYRTVAETGGAVYYGQVYSFITNAAEVKPDTYAGGSSTSKTASSPSAPAAVTVTVTNKSDKINIGDTVEDTISYVNNTGKTLKNATLSIVLPQGFIVKQTTEGVMASQTTVSDVIGTIAPGQKGSVFIEATVGPTTALGDTLVTNATLDYTLPDGTHDSAVGYVINHASRQNVFAGFALGSGFFPSTIFGWLITVIIILTLILIARRIAKQKKHAHHGAHHGDAHGHEAHAHGTHDAPKH